MTVTSTSEAQPAAITSMLLRDVERCARRYHELQQALDSREHKFWRFENCPAPACREMRQHLPGSHIQNVTGPEQPSIGMQQTRTAADATDFNDIVAACGRVFSKRKGKPGPITAQDVKTELGRSKSTAERGKAHAST